MRTVANRLGFDPPHPNEPAPIPLNNLVGLPIRAHQGAEALLGDEGAEESTIIEDGDVRRKRIRHTLGENI
jgi:hypothetical protein